MENKIDTEIYIQNQHNELTFDGQSPQIQNAGALAVQPVEQQQTAPTGMRVTLLKIQKSTKRKAAGAQARVDMIATPPIVNRYGEDAPLPPRQHQEVTSDIGLAHRM